MILESVRVEGLRALEEVGPIAIGRPTILTGRNDSGKSSFLKALGFLLGRTTLRVEDITGAGTGDHASITVTGDFSVSVDESTTADLPSRVEIRRVFRADSASVLEVRKSVPLDENLRDVERLKLPALQRLTTDLGLGTSGNKGHRETHLVALRTFVAGAPVTDLWVRAGSAVEALLPVFVLFSSTEDADPESEVRNALKAAYETIVRDTSFAERISTLEADANARLLGQAEALRDHLLSRTDLEDLVLDPRVSLRPAFSEVVVSAKRLNEDEAFSLRVGGAGRRRQISLAVWEWTSELIRATESVPGARDVVVAYDEPDTHLDYLRQRELMGLLKEQCSSTRVKMVVVTHSLVFIDRIPVQDITLFTLQDGRTQIESLASGEDAAIDYFLSTVSTSMGVRNSTLIHERIFVFVEGDTEARVLPLLFKLIVGLLPQEIGLAVVPCNGNEGALKLGSVLSSRGRTVHVLVDADTETSPSTRKYLTPSKLAEFGFVKGSNLSYVGAAELEDCFSDVIWALAANSSWPREDGVPWTADDFAQHRGTTKFSSGVFSTVQERSLQAPRSKQEMLETVVAPLEGTDGVDTALVEVIQSLAVLE